MAYAGDPERAVGMQAYMKSTMPYYGLRSAQVRDICRQVFDGGDMECEEWWATILEMWRGARRREERYAAAWLLTRKRHATCLTPAAMPALEEMIVTGAWWDHVDELAMVVGDLLARYPKKMRLLMRKWSTDANLWKRRVSIICQLRFKEKTDLDLLYSNIEPNFADRDFFIRKAIGWALRQYAWTDPQEVARYVRAHDSRLSGLSRREALKNIPLPPSGGGAGRGA